MSVKTVISINEDNPTILTDDCRKLLQDELVFLDDKKHDFEDSNYVSRLLSFKHNPPTFIKIVGVSFIYENSLLNFNSSDLKIYVLDNQPKNLDSISFKITNLQLNPKSKIEMIGTIVINRVRGTINVTDIGFSMRDLYRKITSVKFRVELDGYPKE